MRISTDIRLVLLASVALSMIACRDEPQNCVDANNRLLPPSACQTGAPGAHFIYGGSSGGNIGDTVVGGSVTRGGFGSFGGSGDSSGAHGGE